MQAKFHSQIIYSGWWKGQTWRNSQPAGIYNIVYIHQNSFIHNFWLIFFQVKFGLVRFPDSLECVGEPLVRTRLGHVWPIVERAANKLGRNGWNLGPGSTIQCWKLFSHIVYVTRQIVTLFHSERKSFSRYKRDHHSNCNDCFVFCWFGFIEIILRDVY